MKCIKGTRISNIGENNLAISDYYGGLVPFNGYGPVRIYIDCSLYHQSEMYLYPPKGYILVPWGEMSVQKAKLVYNFCKHFTDTSLTFLSFWTKSFWRGADFLFLSFVCEVLVSESTVLGLLMNSNGESCYTEQSLNTPQQQRFLAKWLTQPLMECRMSLFIFHN